MLLLLLMKTLYDSIIAICSSRLRKPEVTIEMKVLIFILLAAGIALFVLYLRSETRNKKLQLTIQNNEKEISGLKNEIISTEIKLFGGAYGCFRGYF